jgi:inhibitor of KinA
VRTAGDSWVIDVVQAYHSVAVYFDLRHIRFAAVAERLRTLGEATPPATSEAARSSHLHHIPCCYDLQLDLDRVAQQTGLPAEEVIRIHAATPYTVYAIGFCPGFPYLGYLPQPLCGTPRLAAPRLRVEPGSVGLTGRQTGIYTEARPGGWNLIGRTPLELVHVRDGYFPLRTGDRVQFERISEAAFHRLKGHRL